LCVPVSSKYPRNIASTLCLAEAEQTKSASSVTGKSAFNAHPRNLPLPGGHGKCNFAEIRASFFDTHWQKFDRQIVLVDTLGALHAGRTAFEDTEHALADIAASLTVGDSILPRWLGGSSIERIAFVATKADHVPELHRDNLRALMHDMVRLAREHAPGDAEVVSYHTAASVVSTTDGWADQPDEHREPVVWGRKLGETQARPYRVGNVPISRPPDSFWSGRYFELPSFTPPPIDPNAANRIPHFGLDQILVNLIRGRL
jgi:predicted YcjX-like family ATPase